MNLYCEPVDTHALQAWNIQLNNLSSSQFEALVQRLQHQLPHTQIQPCPYTHTIAIYCPQNLWSTTFTKTCSLLDQVHHDAALDGVHIDDAPSCFFSILPPQPYALTYALFEGIRHFFVRSKRNG